MEDEQPFSLNEPQTKCETQSCTPSPRPNENENEKTDNINHCAELFEKEAHIEDEPEHLRQARPMSTESEKSKSLCSVDTELEVACIPIAQRTSPEESHVHIASETPKQSSVSSWLWTVEEEEEIPAVVVGEQDLTEKMNEASTILEKPEEIIADNDQSILPTVEQTLETNETSHGHVLSIEPLKEADNNEKHDAGRANLHIDESHLDAFDEEEAKQEIMKICETAICIPALPISEVPDIVTFTDMSDSIESKLFVKEELVDAEVETVITDTEEDNNTGQSLEERFGGVLFPPICLTLGEIPKVEETQYPAPCSELFIRMDEDDILISKDQLWPLPNFDADHSKKLGYVSSTKLDLSQYNENITQEPYLTANSINADALLDALNLSRSTPKEIIKPEPSKAEQEIVSKPLPVSPKEERLRKLDDLLSKLDLSEFQLPDLDPATLRSLIRRESPDCDSNTLTILVEAHILSVCKILVDTPPAARQYIAYCRSCPQYAEAMTKIRLESFCASLQTIFHVTEEELARPNRSDVKAEEQVQEIIPTTILVHAGRVCEDQTCRKICLLLEQKQSISVLERQFLGSPFVTFAFDDTSIGVLLTPPIRTTVDIAKWLVLEAHTYAHVAIFCLLGGSQHPDASTRSAMRQLASTIALLSEPAPKTKLYIAKEEETLAHLIRMEIDTRCSQGENEWYRARDRFKPVLDEIEEKQIQFLSRFPGITVVGAEQILHQWLTPQMFLNSQVGTDSLIAKLLHENLMPFTPYVETNKQAFYGSAVASHHQFDDEVDQSVRKQYSQGQNTPLYQQQHQKHEQSAGVQWGNYMYNPMQRPQTSTMPSAASQLHYRTNNYQNGVADQLGTRIPNTAGIENYPVSPDPITTTPVQPKRQRRLGLSRSDDDKQTRLVWIYSDAPVPAGAKKALQ